MGDEKIITNENNSQFQGLEETFYTSIRQNFKNHLLYSFRAIFEILFIDKSHTYIDNKRELQNRLPQFLNIKEKS